MTVRVDSAVMILRKELFGINCLMSELLMQCNVTPFPYLFFVRQLIPGVLFSLGIFEWGMLYKESNLPEKEASKRERHSEPYLSPTHAGGLFAIRRSWFQELGWYDPGTFPVFHS